MNGTDNALLIRFEEDIEEWIPVSQIADPNDYDVGDMDGTISLTEWIANQKGLS